MGSDITREDLIALGFKLQGVESKWMETYRLRLPGGVISVEFLIGSDPVEEVNGVSVYNGANSILSANLPRLRNAHGLHTLMQWMGCGL